METNDKERNHSTSAPSLPSKKGEGRGLATFLVRTLTGILFVSVMVGGILWTPLSCGLLFLLITVLSVWEFTGLVNARADVQVNRFITTVAASCLYLGFFGFATGISAAVSLFVPWLLSIIYLLIAELYLQRENPLNNWAYSLMAQLYVALPFSLLPLLLFQHAAAVSVGDVPLRAGAYIILFIFVFLWCSDTGAYCFGSLLGRHKLFPRVSPGKTWEGSVGGGLLTVAVSQLIVFFGPADAVGTEALTVFGLSPLQWAGFAVVVVVFGTWGDLVESLLKRKLGIKDSGHILPGHGGMLDRFDSSLLAIPAAMAYLSVLSLL